MTFEQSRCFVYSKYSGLGAPVDMCCEGDVAACHQHASVGRKKRMVKKQTRKTLSAAAKAAAFLDSQSDEGSEEGTEEESDQEKLSKKSPARRESARKKQSRKLSAGQKAASFLDAESDVSDLCDLESSSRKLALVMALERDENKRGIDEEEKRSSEYG